MAPKIPLRCLYIATRPAELVLCQGPNAKGGGAAGGSAAGGGEGDTGANKPPPTPEEPIEYTDASGKLKFNKRPAAGAAGAGRDGDKGSKKKKGKRAKLAKLNNAKLLSFGDEEDG